MDLSHEELKQRLVYVTGWLIKHANSNPTMRRAMADLRDYYVKSVADIDKAAHVCWSVDDVKTAVTRVYGPRARVDDDVAHQILGDAESGLRDIMIERGWAWLEHHVQGYIDDVKGKRKGM